MSIILAEVQQALNDWGTTIVGQLGDALPREKDVEGAGAETLRQSIRFTISKMGFPITFQLTMNDYWKYVDAGRLPGKYPPLNVIRQWIINKGLAIQRNGKIGVLHGSMPKKGLKAKITKKQKLISDDAQLLKSLTFLFARKIAQKGIPATPFYTNTVTEQAINDLQASLTKAFNKDVIVKIIEIKNDIQNKKT